MNARDALDVEMAAVLGQLAVCSNTAASGYGVRGARSDEHPGGRRPPGDLDTEHLARRYGPPFHICTSWCTHRGRPAANDDERRQVIKDARDELAHLRGQAKRPRYEGETHEQLVARMLTETRGMAPEVAATTRFRFSATLIRRHRRAAKLDEETGAPLIADVALPPEERAAEARRLVDDEGYSIAYAARKLGVNRSTIERDLGRAGRARAA